MRRLLCITLCCVPLLTSYAYSKTYKLGEEFDKEAYLSVPKVASLSRGSFDDLPSSVSLTSYAPAIGSQGESGSCVGWASSYAVASIAWALTVEQAEGQLPKTTPFSPSFTFNRIKVSEDCEGGSDISLALKDLARNGTLPLSQFAYSDKVCNRVPTTTEYNSAQKFAIEGYRRLSSAYSRRSLHLSVRRALAQKHPVVFGMLIGPSFMKYETQNGVLKIHEMEQQLYDQVGLEQVYQYQEFGGHAMAVVGYDDERAGGSFLIMNSWSTQWGDKGFGWVTYDDFIRWVHSAYEVIPQIYKKPEPKKADFKGNIVLKGFRQTDLPLVSDGQGYQLSTPLHSGARLRAEVSVSTDSYVYVIGTDDSSGKHTVLFPQSNQVSPLISAGNTMLLPGPTEDYYSRLDNTAGTDYLIVLHSRKPLDANQLVKAMNLNNSNDVYKRLGGAIGARLIEKDKLKFSNNAYEAIMGNDGVLANVVSVKHLAQSVSDNDKTGPSIVIVSPEVDNADAYVDGNKNVRYVSGDELVIKGIAQDESEIAEVSITNGFDIKYSSRGPFVARVDLTNIPVGGSKVITMTSRDQHNNESTQSITLYKVQP